MAPTPTLEAGPPDARRARPGMTLERELRALGQALEDLDLADVEVRVVGNRYVARGSAKAPRGANAGVGPFSRLWLLLRARSIFGTRPSVHEFTREDLALRDRAGQARRGKPRNGRYGDTPSELLRTIGHYLDRRRARPITITRRGPDVTITYATPMAKTVTERF